MPEGIDEIIRKESEAKGKAEGLAEKEETVVLNMLRKNVAYSLIEEYASVTLERIEELRLKFIKEGRLQA